MIFWFRFSIALCFQNAYLGIPHSTVTVSFKAYPCRHFAFCNAGTNKRKMIDPEIEKQLINRSAINVFHEFQAHTEKNMYGNTQNVLGGIQQTRNLKKKIISEHQIDTDLTTAIQTLANKWRAEDQTVTEWDASGWIWGFDPIEFSLGFWSFSGVFFLVCNIPLIQFNFKLQIKKTYVFVFV